MYVFNSVWGCLQHEMIICSAAVSHLLSDIGWNRVLLLTIWQEGEEKLQASFGHYVGQKSPQKWLRNTNIINESPNVKKGSYMILRNVLEHLNMSQRVVRFLHCIVASSLRCLWKQVWRTQMHRRSRAVYCWWGRKIVCWILKQHLLE